MVYYGLVLDVLHALFVRSNHFSQVGSAYVLVNALIFCKVPQSGVYVPCLHLKQAIKPVMLLLLNDFQALLKVANILVLVLQLVQQVNHSCSSAHFLKKVLELWVVLFGLALTAMGIA